MKRSWNMIWPLKFANPCFLLQIMPLFFQPYHRASHSRVISWWLWGWRSDCHCPVIPWCVWSASSSAGKSIPTPWKQRLKVPWWNLRAIWQTPNDTWARNQLKDGFNGFPYWSLQSSMWHTYIESYIHRNLLEPIRISKVGVVHVPADYFGKKMERYHVFRFLGKSNLQWTSRPSGVDFHGFSWICTMQCFSAEVFAVAMLVELQLKQRCTFVQPPGWKVAHVAREITWRTSAVKSCPLQRY